MLILSVQVTVVASSFALEFDDISNLPKDSIAEAVEDAVSKTCGVDIGDVTIISINGEVYVAGGTVPHTTLSHAHRAIPWLQTIFNIFILFVQGDDPSCELFPCNLADNHPFELLWE